MALRAVLPLPAIIVLAVLVPGARCGKELFANQHHVLDMNPVDFEAQVINDTTGPAWVAMLYANWCGHCHHYAPTFIKHAEAFEKDPRVKFAACDCATYHNFCTTLGIESYPTLRGFRFARANASEAKPPAETARVGEEVPREVEAWVRAHLPPSPAGNPGTDGRARPPTNLRDRFVRGRKNASSTRPRGAASPAPPRVPVNASLARSQGSAQAEARAAAIGDGGLAAARAASPLDADVRGSAPDEDDQAGLRLVDAEVAVLYSLRQGTFLKGEAVAGSPLKAFIQGKVLDELCAWLEFLAAAFPSARASADLRAFLGVALAAQAGGGLSAAAWDEILDRRGLDRAPPQAGRNPEQYWRICTSYTCGLWTLFHVLTLSVAEGRWVPAPEPATAPGLRGSAGGGGAPAPVALRRIRGFVANFFGCGECAAHFLETFDSCAFDRCDLSEGDGPGAAVWLSAVHNRVADRVARENDPCQSAGCSFGCLDPSGSCSSFEGAAIPSVRWDDPGGAEGSALGSCANRTACSSRGFRLYPDGDAPGSWPPRASCPRCWTGPSDRLVAGPRADAVYGQLASSYWRREWTEEARGVAGSQQLAGCAALGVGLLAALWAARYVWRLQLRTATKCS